MMMTRSESTVPGRLVRGGLGYLAMVVLTVGGTALAADATTPMTDNSPGATKVYTPGPDVTAPILQIAPDPEFPKSAKLTAGESVICVVRLVVDRNGIPEDVHVVRSAGTAFDTNAIKAVRQYRFKPALRNNDPVAAAIKVQVRFRTFRKLSAVRSTN
jgi:TonB family protein